jgi:hypothetical protein
VFLQKSRDFPEILALFYWNFKKNRFHPKLGHNSSLLPSTQMQDRKIQKNDQNDDQQATLSCPEYPDSKHLSETDRSVDRSPQLQPTHTLSNTFQAKTETSSELWHG